MEEYQEKMLEELKDLTEKRRALFRFITEDETFNSLTEEKQQDMRKQWIVMKEYEMVLRKRCKNEHLLDN